MEIYRRLGNGSKRNIYTVDLVLDKLKEHKSDFSFSRLNEFSKKYSKTVRRVLGFLLDKLSLDSTYIYGLVKGSKDCSYMTKDGAEFSSKWRLYYHSHLKNAL